MPRTDVTIQPGPPASPRNTERLRTHFLIVNPRAGSGSLGRRWESEITPRLAAVLGPFDCGLTAHPGHATELARRAAEADYETIVAMGGDGTLNEVVNGLFANGRPVSPRTSLGLIPFGSGGDFARTAGVPRDYALAAEYLKKSEPRPVDVGLVHYDDPAHAPRHFLNIADAGVVADIMVRVNALPRGYPALARYLWGTFLGFRSFEPVRVRLTFDGDSATECLLSDLVVANGRFFGRGMQPAPEARLDDGLLDVIVLKNTGTLTFFRNVLPKLYTGRFPASSSLYETRRCREVRVEKLEREKPLRVEMDGETYGEGGASFRILPSALLLKWCSTPLPDKPPCARDRRGRAATRS